MGHRTESQMSLTGWMLEQLPFGHCNVGKKQLFEGIYKTCTEHEFKNKLRKHITNIALNLYVLKISVTFKIIICSLEILRIYTSFRKQKQDIQLHENALREFVVYRNRRLDKTETNACWDWLRVSYWMKLCTRTDRNINVASHVSTTLIIILRKWDLTYIKNRRTLYDVPFVYLYCWPWRTDPVATRSNA
jgi:hypothetical protein